MPLLELLAPLLKKRDTYYLFAILLLGLAFWATLKRARGDEAALAARPAVHTEAEQKTQIVRVSGPVRVETKTVYVPGTNTVQYVDRIVETGTTTTTTQKESEVVKDARPACPAAAQAPWRYAGAVLDATGPRALRGGVTFWNRLDVGLSYDFKYHAAGAEAALRF